MRNLCLLLLVGAAVTVAACGGDDSGALSQDDFVSQGNAICADFNAQLAALDSPTDANDYAGLAQFAEDSVAIVEPALAKLKELTPPADLQDQWDAYIANAEQGITVVQQLHDAAEAHDAQQVKSLAAKINSLNNDDNAAALGLTECAKGPDE